jgi:hypothetical protein
MIRDARVVALPVPERSRAELLNELVDVWRHYSELKAAFLSLQDRHAALVAQSKPRANDDLGELQAKYELLQTQYIELQKAAYAKGDELKLD